MDNQSQADLLKALIGIFPDFEAVWEKDNEGDTSPSESLHGVYFSFLPFLATTEATPRQLQRLAALLNSAVSAGGDAENAVATCFFEALGPGNLLRSLRPLLSLEAKSRLHP